MQQQEKCQSTLTSVAKSRPNVTQKAFPVAASPSMSARTPAPAVRFSNDTERLQHINSIRKAPAGAQIKRVISKMMNDVGDTVVVLQSLRGMCMEGLLRWRIVVASSFSFFNSLSCFFFFSYDCILLPFF